jgi:PAS domain S-box-containing protein
LKIALLYYHINMDNKRGSKIEKNVALRQKAEDGLTHKEKERKRHAVVTGPVPPPLNLSEADILKLYYELQVSQIELRMQNDEISLAKERAEVDAEKFAELYNSAPTGYFTLSTGGNIVELNPSGAQMLGSDCLLLINSRFGIFVANDSKSIFHHFLGRVFNSQSKDVCEVILKINNQLHIDVRLTGIAKRGGEYCLVTMVDISELKRTERELVIANMELAFQCDENAKRAEELIIANAELLFHNDEKAKRAEELIIANKELLFQSDESENRGFDLLVSNNLIAFQRDRLQKITSLVPGVVFQYRLYPDGSSGFPYSSEAIIQMYRVTPEEIVADASTFFAKLHPDDLKGFVSSIKKSAKDLTPWQREFRALFDDGSIRFHAGSGLPQPEEDGSVLWHGIITDITEQRHLEDALHRS